MYKHVVNSLAIKYSTVVLWYYDTLEGIWEMALASPRKIKYRLINSLASTAADLLISCALLISLITMDRVVTAEQLHPKPTSPSGNVFFGRTGIISQPPDWSGFDICWENLTCLNGLHQI